MVKLRLQAERAPEANHPERKRRMTEHARAHLNKICCAIKDGVEECHEKYCVIHVRKNVQRLRSRVLDAYKSPLRATPGGLRRTPQECVRATRPTARAAHQHTSQNTTPSHGT